MTIDWTNELAEQLDWHWKAHVRPHLDGLSDDEYFWEPVDGCWSVRPKPDGEGFMADWADPEPDPAPVTTIAWRLAHITVGVFGARNASHFGGPPMDYLTYEYPATAKQALQDLDESYDRWITGVRGMSAADLAKPVGPAEGQWAEFSYASLVFHINREAIHHGAEILLLRDLWRNVSRGRQIG